MKIEILNRRHPQDPPPTVRNCILEQYDFHASILLCCVFFFLAMPLRSSGQNILLNKQIIGAGGMVELQNQSGIKISGILTQTAIEPIYHPTGTDYIHILEGFWVPNSLNTSVTDSLDLINQNINIYPNPVSKSASIYYYLPNPSLVTIKSYDILGGLVAVIYYGIQESGSKSFIWDVGEVRNGTYLITVEVKSMVTHGNLMPKLIKYNKKVVVLK